MNKLLKQTKKRLPSIKSLKAKCWKLMSEHVRTSNLISGDFNKCVTCGCLRHYKEMHAGHFIHASKGSFVSYDDRNINPQCPKCNTYQGGRLIEYTIYMIDLYGPEIVDELKQLKQTIMKRKDFEEVINRLTN